eukprot:365942-Chlamydomonas_euryale.AAC.23
MVPPNSLHARKSSGPVGTVSVAFAKHCGQVGGVGLIQANKQGYYHVLQQGFPPKPSSREASCYLEVAVTCQRHRYGEELIVESSSVDRVKGHQQDAVSASKKH